MQVTGNSDKQVDGQTCPNKTQAQKRLVEQLNGDWKRLWAERFDDKVRAEGISQKDYKSLFVERGTVIHATKDFKAPTFKKILEQHMVENPDRYTEPDNNIGGWSKFIKNNVRSSSKKNLLIIDNTDKPKGQSKKGGRGWLHRV